MNISLGCSLVYRVKSPTPFVFGFDAARFDVQMTSAVPWATWVRTAHAANGRSTAWGEGFNEDLEQARRVAAAIVEALRRSGFQISRKPPAPHHSTPKGP